ncbi:MAG: hypothetical protein GX446_09900, partial [Chthonomonadales bacterium]|nr:hypothetical protein [Chthonomonadales bacterium]
MSAIARSAAALIVAISVLAFAPLSAGAQNAPATGSKTQGKTAPKADTNQKSTVKSRGAGLTVLPGLSTGGGVARLAMRQDGQQTPPPGQQTPPPGQQTPPPGQQTPPPGQQTPPPGQQTPPPGEQTTPPGSGQGNEGRERGSSRFDRFSGRSSNQFGGGGTITLDFRGSDIGNVLKFFAMATNWQIVPDANLTGPVTIISPKPLTLDQAFQVLQSTLEVRGFSGQIEKRGDTTILKIVPLDRAVQSTPLLGGPDSGLSPDEIRGQVITQVIPIENVDAASLSRELQPLINKGASMVGSAGTNALVVTDTASNVKRISELVKLLDKAASNNELRMFKLQNSDATDVANAINTLFRQVYTR